MESIQHDSALAVTEAINETKKRLYHEHGFESPRSSGWFWQIIDFLQNNKKLRTALSF